MQFFLNPWRGGVGCARSVVEWKKPWNEFSDDVNILETGEEVGLVERGVKEMLAVFFNPWRGGVGCATSAG